MIEAYVQEYRGHGGGRFLNSDFLNFTFSRATDLKKIPGNFKCQTLSHFYWVGGPRVKGQAGRTNFTSNSYLRRAKDSTFFPMSRYGNNAAKPFNNRLPGIDDEIPEPSSPQMDYPATVPIDLTDEEFDEIAKIRQKRKRAELLKTIPEAKRVKVDLPKPGEPTVLVIFNIQGSWKLRTNKFVMK